MTKKKETNKTYRKPRIGVFVGFMCNQYGLDEGKVIADLRVNFPELFKKDTCANCGASMSEYIYTLDLLDSLLLFGMGKIVYERVAKGIPFTEANKIHLQSTLNTYYSVPSRSTQCSKLGLIAKVLRKDGTHDQKAGWCITKRGFEFLAGKRVPKRVQVFRNEITDRPEELTTCAEVMSQSIHKQGGVEYKNYQKYNFSELETWAVAGFAQGKLL